MTEEKNQDKDRHEQTPAAIDTQGVSASEQLKQVSDSDATLAPKKWIVTRKKIQLEADQQAEVAAMEEVTAAMEEVTAATEQAPVARRAKGTAVKKTRLEVDGVSADTSNQRQLISEAQSTLVDVTQGESDPGMQESGSDNLQDVPKPPRRRVTRKRVANEVSDNEAQQVTAGLEDNPVKEKHDKKMPRGKQGSSGGAKSTQSSKNVAVLSFSESVSCFVQHYHQVVTCLDDLSFRDALAKLHGQQSHWKPQLEEAISVFLDEALYVEEGMSLSKLRRAVATASDLWGAAYTAVVHTQGHFVRAAQVVARLMQSLGEIMQLDFVVPMALEEAFKPVSALQDSEIDSQVAGGEETAFADQEKTSENAPSTHTQQEEGGATTLLGVLQPFASHSPSNLLEDAQKRFTEMAARVRQFSQSGVAQSSSYGYLVGAFYGELTVMQLALLVCVERQQQQDKPGQRTCAAYQAWTLLGQFKSELLPVVRATGVFSAESDRRRGRGQAVMHTSESLTALLAAMNQSVSISAEPNHNSRQAAGQDYFQPPDLD